MSVIGFHLNELCERGVPVAVYDYAHYAETLLNHRSVIFVPAAGNNNELVKQKFTRRFDVVFYSTIKELRSKIVLKGVNIFYSIKYGTMDTINITNIKHVVHVVFDTRHQHGDVYAPISEELNIKWGTGYPVVPHMINLPQVNGDLRRELCIPEDAIVFGRYGGYHQFDIPFVHDAIARVIEKRHDVYFLFANTSPFITHSRVIYMEPIIDLESKVKFIQTCDAHISARKDGETFGLTVGEFSIKGVPTITCNSMGYQQHSRIMGSDGIYYQDEESCYQALMQFKPLENYHNGYEEYTPEKVMNTFARVFLDSTFIPHEGVLFQVYVNDRLARNLLRKQKWEPHVVKFASSYLKDDSVVIDVGANFGHHTLFFSKMVPNGKVIAFEPQLENFELLKTNISMNEARNIDARYQAVGAENKKVKVPRINTSVLSNMGDITVESSDGREVECITLDSLGLDRVDLIKIDVQGYELYTLLGAEEMLTTLKPTMIIELEDQQLAKFNLESSVIVDYLKDLEYEWFFLEYSYPSDHIAVHRDNIRHFMDTFGSYMAPHNTSNGINRNVELGITRKIKLDYM